jgi:hypothetical protein
MTPKARWRPERSTLENGWPRFMPAEFSDFLSNQNTREATANATAQCIALRFSGFNRIPNIAQFFLHTVAVNHITSGHSTSA